MGVGTCAAMEAGSGGSRGHVKSPPLPALTCWSWLPWGEAGADGGLGLLLDHTPGPAHPGCQPELGLQRLSFLSEDRVLSPALPPPTPVSSLRQCRGGCRWVRTQGVVSQCHAGGQPSHYAHVGPGFCFSEAHGEGVRREGRTQAMGAAPWAGAKSPWEVPQPREPGCSLTEAGISPQVPLLLFHFQVRKAIITKKEEKLL